MSTAHELPISDVRDHLADVVGRAQHAGEATVIVKRGKRIAAVVPIEALALLDRIEDDYWSRRAAEALDEPGEPIPHAEAMRMIGLDD